MSKSYNILKVRDKNDSYYTPIENLFDLPFRLLINGKSQLSGKSTIILNLLLSPEFPYFGLFEGDNIYIVSNNKLDNKLDMMAKKLEIPDENRMVFDEDHLEILYEDWEESFQDETQDGGKPANRLVVFDDCGYSGCLKSYKKENIVEKMICNGRHLNLSQIYTSQRFSQVSTTLRTNLTGAILFNTSAKELELITEDMNYMAKSKDFIEMFRRETRDRRSFLVVNFSNSPDELYMNQFFQALDTRKQT